MLCLMQRSIQAHNLLVAKSRCLGKYILGKKKEVLQYLYNTCTGAFPADLVSSASKNSNLSNLGSQSCWLCFLLLFAGFADNVSTAGSPQLSNALDCFQFS